jgi:hypothetical protein
MIFHEDKKLLFHSMFLKRKRLIYHFEKKRPKIGGSRQPMTGIKKKQKHYMNTKAVLVDHWLKWPQARPLPPHPLQHPPCVTQPLAKQHGGLHSLCV